MSVDIVIVTKATAFFNESGTFNSKTVVFYDMLLA